MPRPRSKNPSTAAERKRRQMQRLREDGFAHVIVHPAKDTTEKLRSLAALTHGTLKETAEMVLRRAAGNALREAESLAQRIGPVYNQAKPFFPVARFLEQPGSRYRIRSTTFTYEQWHPLAQQLDHFYALVRRWGWKRDRAMVFLEEAAKRHPTTPA